jgi:hypothetical protein
LHKKGQCVKPTLAFLIGENMAGQKTISTTYQPPPEPPTPLLPTSGTFHFDLITTYMTIRLIFTDAMSDHAPENSVFFVKFDETPYVPDGPHSWLTNKIYKTIKTPIGYHPASALISYDGTDPLFASATGKAVAPFSDFVLTET